MFAIFPQEPANGTKSNIACSATSRRTGAVVPWKAKLWSFNSLPTHVLQKGWQSNPRLTIRSILQVSKSRTQTWQDCQSFAMNFTANGITKSIRATTDIVQVIISNLLRWGRGLARYSRARFQPPPRQTQHADFPHYAFSVNFMLMCLWGRPCINAFLNLFGFNPNSRVITRPLWTALLVAD